MPKLSGWKLHPERHGIITTAIPSSCRISFEKLPVEPCRRAALYARRIVRSPRYAPCHARIRPGRDAGRIEPDAGEWGSWGPAWQALSQRRRCRGKTHPAGGLGELFGTADTECMGRLWRGLLDQSRRQFWREIPDRAWLATRRLLRQGNHRAICHRDSVRTAGDRPSRQVAELAAGWRWRVRSRPRRRCRDRRRVKFARGERALLR